MEQDPIALEVYETIAERYAAQIETKAHNAYYERPAMLSLLPAVQGKRVLDAGCGPGLYTEWLVEHGAEVVGIDVSPKMVAIAANRLQGRAQIQLADLGQPLNFLAEESFDLVLSPLVLDYLPDWRTVFKEFYRLLRPAGHFVFSVGHPFDEFYDHHPTGNYFALEKVSYRWSGFGVPVDMPYYRRPLSEMINPLIDAGFAVERVLEPVPIEQFKEVDPGDYVKLNRQPGFICFRARK